MAQDITRQPLSMVMMQFFLLSMLFLCRVEYFPAVNESINLSSGFALAGWIDTLVDQNSLINHILILCIVFVNAILITRIITSNMILGTRTYIPSLIYLTVSCGIFIGCNLSGYIASMFVIIGSHSLIRGFRQLSSFDFLFKGGFLIGISILLCFETLLLGIMVGVALVVFRRSAREAVVAFTALALPILIYSYIYWGMGFDFSYIAISGWQSMALGHNYGTFVSAITITQLIFASILTLIIFMSIGSFIVNIRNMRTRAYRIFIYFIWLLVIGLAIFFIPSHSPLGYSILAIPCSVIAPYYFVRTSNRFSTIIYSCLMASIVIANILPFLL